MAFTLSNYGKNIIELTNTDLTGPMSYTLYAMDTDNFFSPVSGFPSNPTSILASGAIFTTDLMSDNIYKLVVAGTPNTEYYFLLDYNIKVCEKDKLKKLLCDPCNNLDALCNLKKYITEVYDYNKFKLLKDNLYFIYNKIVQTQSIVDLTVPPNGELVYLKDMKDKLALICGACSDNSCGTTSSYPNTTECGCN